MKFFLLFFISFFIISHSTKLVVAPFQYAMGENVYVSADKGYRYGKENRFEVIGNVVIVHQEESLYGERGNLELNTGQIEVKGNVRYVGPEMTLYGSEIQFNAQSSLLAVRHARILTRGYAIQGDYMTRVAPNVLLADDAEYSTCRDCPESWSVYGKKVRIVLGEYVYITHALVKVNSVGVMYLPYLVLPIKKKRQTGLLFPQFSLSFKEGLNYRQPWFWAMSSNYDMTLTPWSKGKRGLGSEIEYRHILGDSRWFEINGLLTNDRIYYPGKIDDELSGRHYQRNFLDYEHHYQWKNFLTHHLTYQSTGDLDIFGDFESFVRQRVEGPDMGLRTFFNARTSYFDNNVEGFYRRSILNDDPKKFDNHSVQILPHISVESTPVTLWRSGWPIFPHAAFGMQSSFDHFRQNKFKEANFIRNADRYTFNPYLEIALGRLKFLEFKTSVQADYQYYRFPFETQKEFHKRGTLFLSEMTFEMDRIYGLAYEEKVPLSRLGNAEEIIEKKRKEKLKQDQDKIKEEESLSEHESQNKGLLIQDLSQIQTEMSDELQTITKASFRHAIKFNLRHHYTSDQSYRGNERFGNQIKYEEGLFDYQDAQRKVRHEIGSLSSKTDISQRNTIEFVWLNDLFSKNSSSGLKSFEDDLYLRDQFTYTRVASFNISQGLEVRTAEKHFIDKLTRLYVNSSFPFFGWSLSFSDYYFYRKKQHKMSSGIGRTFDFFNFNLGLEYDSVSYPIQKFYSLSTTINPLPTWSFNFQYKKSMTTQQSLYTVFGLGYAPLNNCWKIDWIYRQTTDDTEILFNLLINFGENRFTSLLNPSGVGP